MAVKGTLTRLVAPTAPLLSLMEGRDQCREDDGVSEFEIQAFIASAEAYLDAKNGVLGEALVTQTWRLAFSEIPGGSFEIPLGPVQSITAIGYVDVAGATQVFSSANYRLVGSVIELVSGASWPAVQTREAAFWVDFVAGYGVPSAVPESIRTIAKLMVGDLYRHREATTDQPVEMSAMFQHLMGAARSARGLF